MLRLLRLPVAGLCALALVVLPAQAAPVELMPGVTWEKQVQFTPRGPVALTVITAPKPGGLTTIGPVVSGGSLTGPRLKVTQIQRSLGNTAVTAGINADFANASGLPNGIVVRNGVYEHTPTPGRSSIGFDASGTLRVNRFSFVGTWRGTGQRRPLAGVNQRPKANGTVLFTPAWGAATPAVGNATVIVLRPFASAVPNTDLEGTVAEIASASTPIPTDGAVLVATGAEAAKLAAEASLGTVITARLILPSSWAGVTSAVGGGPLLARNRKAVFKTSENFAADQLMSRDARAAVGQLEDGRVLLVAVDGGRPGHSVGMTTYELAQTMVRLGAVTAAALEPGKAVTAAFHGQVLNRPSGRAGELPVKEALLVQYEGVHAPLPAASQLVRQGGGGQLAYTVVRPSTVTAELVAPDGTSRPVDSGERQAGTYRFPQPPLDVEGTWRWRIAATDDKQRQSVAERSIQVDFTLSAPRASSGRAPRVGFMLSRPADVALRIETSGGTLVASVPPARLEAGAQSLTWDGAMTGGAKARAGTYVARVVAVSAVGTSELSAGFSLRR